MYRGQPELYCTVFAAPGGQVRDTSTARYLDSCKAAGPQKERKGRRFPQYVAHSVCTLSRPRRSRIAPTVTH